MCVMDCVIKEETRLQAGSQCEVRAGKYTRTASEMLVSKHLNLRACKFSLQSGIHNFVCISKIFYIKFQSGFVKYAYNVIFTLFCCG